jgi:hypothetical protein
MRTISTLIAVCVGLAGCASEAPLESRLDESAATWIRMDSAVTWARPAPRLAGAAARDYLYLAPVEGNRMGAREHYLWVGLGTTVDRGWPWAAPESAATLLLVLDDMPLALPLTAWDAAAAPLYDTPAPVYAALRARVTLDQLERIANAQSLEVEIVSEQGAVARYDLWGGAWADWNAFIAGVGDEPRRFGAVRR